MPQSKEFVRQYIKINDDVCGAYSTNSQTKIKTIMWKSKLCDYSTVYTYILIEGTIKITERGTDAAAIQAREGVKQVTHRTLLHSQTALAK